MTAKEKKRKDAMERDGITEEDIAEIDYHWPWHWMGDMRD